MTEAELFIGGQKISRASKPYVVAELSGNHNGSLERALEIVEAASMAGADAIKLQTYTGETITIDHNGPGFVLDTGPWAGRSLYDLYEWAHTPWEWHSALFAKGRELGLSVFSSPFDATAVDFLEQFDPPAYKIASFELVDLPLIRYVAKKRRPVIMSTGMATLSEIQAAVDVARDAGSESLCLLHCTSAYPTPVRDANLMTIEMLAENFDIAVGISDHTLGITVPVAAVALGACLIEKHLTLRRADGGPDSGFSLEPMELKELVDNVHAAHSARGNVRFAASNSELPQIQLRRSLYVVADICAGELFTSQNLRSIRPGYGLPPAKYDDVIGRRAKENVARGTPLSWDLVA
ncbi:MAG: pseudaminic acid synthase [Woeseia sp.]|nr:pseudaminic acid synthase [Woeseia sp.]